MTRSTLIVAGPSGGTSTFLGGLYHYVDKQDALTLTSNVVGDSQSYK